MTLRVRELIEQLQHLPPDDPIWAKGWHPGDVKELVWEIDAATSSTASDSLLRPLSIITLTLLRRKL